MMSGGLLAHVHKLSPRESETLLHVRPGAEARGTWIKIDGKMTRSGSDNQARRVLEGWARGVETGLVDL